MSAMARLFVYGTLIATTAGECWAYHWPGPTSGFQPITSWIGR
jgi:hypothetical protein